MTKLTVRPVDLFTGKPLAPARTIERTQPSPSRSAGPAGPADTSEYPSDGTVDDVVAWVDAAPTDELRSERAKAAIAAELVRGKPRKTLMERLDERTS